MVDVKMFHTGTRYENLFDPNCIPEYTVWQRLKPNVKYADIHAISSINNDGLLDAVDFEELMIKCKTVINNNMIPILSLWVGNFETLTEETIRNFFLKVKQHIGDNTLIFKPCWEFNTTYPELHWGQRDGKNWYIKPEDYSRTMLLMRFVRDSTASNILLACHMNLHTGWDVALYLPWMEGARECDIFGLSVYSNDISIGWSKSKEVFDMLEQPEKPFFMFEYAPRTCAYFPDEPECVSVTSPEYVNNSYGEILKNPWVKALNWWFGESFDESTMEALKINVEQYEGFVHLEDEVKVKFSFEGILKIGGLLYLLEKVGGK